MFQQQSRTAMNVEGTAEVYNPISRNLEKALIKLVDAVTCNHAYFNGLERSDDNLILLNPRGMGEYDGPCKQEIEETVAILNKYIDRAGNYIGPKKAAVAYGGRKLVCKSKALDTDGFTWLLGRFEIQYEYVFDDESNICLVFGQD